MKNGWLNTGWFLGEAEGGTCWLGWPCLSEGGDDGGSEIWFAAVAGPYIQVLACSCIIAYDQRHKLVWCAVLLVPLS